MELRTPITGTLIVVDDSKAARFIEMGFTPVAPKKAPVRRRRAAKRAKEQ